MAEKFDFIDSAKYDFKDPEKYAFRTPKGLNKEVVEEISRQNRNQNGCLI